MKQCCYNLQTVGLECHCNEQSRPDSFTVEEIRKYISTTHHTA